MCQTRKGQTPEDVRANDGWKYETKAENVDIFIKKSEGVPLNGTKGVGPINMPADVVAYVFFNSPRRHLWDEMFEDTKVLERIDQRTFVNWTSFKAPWPISGRDFVGIGRYEVWEDGSIFIYNCSVTHPSKPPTSKHVRGELVYCGVLITPGTSAQGEPMCTVCYTVMSDPKGSIPPGLVNAANIKQPCVVGFIRKYLNTAGTFAATSKDMKAHEEKLEEVFGSGGAKKQAGDDAGAQEAVESKSISPSPSSSSPSSSSSTSTSNAAAADGNVVVNGRSQANYAISISPLPPCKHDKILQKCYDEAWRAVTRLEDDGWKFATEEEGVKVYLKAAPPGQEINFSKGIGIIPGSPETVRCVFAAASIRPKWDEMYDKGQVLETLDMNTVISYASFKAPWPVSGRDFCSIGRSVLLPDGSILVYYSNFEDPRAPTNKKLVRGELIYSALWIKPVPGQPNKSEVVYAIGTNPKGSIPVSLVNAANIKQPLCVAKIGKLIATDKATVAQAIAAEKAKYAQMLAKLSPQPKTAAAAAAASVSSTSTSSASAGVVGDADASAPVPVAAAAAGGPDQNKYNITVGPLPPSRHDAILQRCYNDAWRAVTRLEDDGWKLETELEGISIYLKAAPPGQEINFSKGIGIIPGSPETVRCVFAAAPIRPKWDEMYDKGQVLEALDTNTVISYASFKAPWPVSGRDFCSIGRSLVLNDGSILVFYTNFEDPRAPTNKKLVRGELIYSALWIKPVPGQPNKSEVVYAIGTDPKGSIPVSLVNAANIKQPLCVAKIGKLIATDPASVQQAIAIDKANVEAIRRRLGISSSSSSSSSAASAAARSGKVGARSRQTEPIPGVSTVSWSQYDTHPWCAPLRGFTNTGIFPQLSASISYIQATGGLFPLRKPGAPETLPPNSFSLGVLAIKIAGLCGTYLELFRDANLKCVISYDSKTVSSGKGPDFSSTTPNGFTFPVRDPRTTINVAIIAEKGNNSSTVGTVILSLGDLHNGASSSDPDTARRGWYALSGIPPSFIRAANAAAKARYSLENSSSSGGDLGDAATASTSDSAAGGAPGGAVVAIAGGENDIDLAPKGLFVCLESCFVYSLQRWLAYELQSTPPVFRGIRAPAAAALRLPVPCLTKEDVKKVRDSQTALEKQTVSLSTTLTGAGQWGDVEEDVADYVHSVTVPSTETSKGAFAAAVADAAAAEAAAAISTDVFVPEVLVHNVVRLTEAAEPFIDVITAARRIFMWETPSHSALACLLWALAVLHYQWLPLLLITVFLWVAILTAANNHFKEAVAAGGVTSMAYALRRRDAYAAQYANQLRTLSPSLSPHAKAMLLTLQTVTGRIASLLERASSPLDWSRGDDVTGFTFFILIVLLVLSIMHPSYRVALAGLYFIFAWHSSLMLLIRHTVICFIRFHLSTSAVHRDSQLVRLLALRSTHVPEDVTEME